MMSSTKSAKPPRKLAAKEPHEMTHAEKLRLIDDELNAFYKLVIYVYYNGGCGFGCGGTGCIEVVWR